MDKAIYRNFDRKSISDATHEDATFAIYTLVFSLVSERKMTLASATAVLGRMLGSFTNAWHVVGITEEALKSFEPHVPNFVTKPKGLQRAHIFSRYETINDILSSRLEKDQLFKLWRQRDKTVLGLSGQNRNILDSWAYHFENSEGTFFQNAMIGFAGSRRDYVEFHKWISIAENRGQLVKVDSIKKKLLVEMQI